MADKTQLNPYHDDAPQLSDEDERILDEIAEEYRRKHGITWPPKPRPRDPNDPVEKMKQKRSTNA